MHPWEDGPEYREGIVRKSRYVEDVHHLRLMSLDGVRKYYEAQRGLIDQRLVALEAGRDGGETGSSAGAEGRDPESSV